MFNNKENSNQVMRTEPLENKDGIDNSRVEGENKEGIDNSRVDGGNKEATDSSDDS